MFKEALIGIGLACDISGSQYLLCQPVQTEQECLASDWKNVGDFLRGAMITERPKIEAEAAQQLQLRLDPVKA